MAMEAVDDRRAQAVAVLEQLLRAMDVPATLETKDLPDGGISIAVTPGVELAGVVSGRRSPLGDALQYLVNKLVNKPGQERRWVAIGFGAHPEPRGQKPARPASPAPAPMTNGSPPPAHVARPAPPPRPAPAPRPQDGDERTLVSDADAPFEAAARSLAERSVSSGRVYAVVTLGALERGRLLRSTDGVEGVSGRAEGEGRLRRVVLTPDKVLPMPRQRLPVDDLPEDD
jgi:predicted RNA-binding protein Jag